MHSQRDVWPFLMIIIVEKVIAKHEGRMKDLTFIREVVEEELEQYIYDKLGRTPMIIPVLIEV